MDWLRDELLDVELVTYFDRVRDKDELDAVLRAGRTYDLVIVPEVWPPGSLKFKQAATRLMMRSGANELRYRDGTDHWKLLRRVQGQVLATLS